MNKVLEVVLTALALAGLYCAIPASVAKPGNSQMRVQQTVMVADGSDPMPLCRKGRCVPTP